MSFRNSNFGQIRQIGKDVGRPLSSVACGPICLSSLSGLSVPVLFLPLFFLSVLSIFPVSSFANSLSNADLDSSVFFRMNHLSAKDSYNQKSISQAALGLDMQYSLFDSTSLHFSPLVRFKSGHQQTQSESRSQQGHLSLQESTLNYQPSFNQHHSALLSGGILAIGNDSSSLLLKDQSFPGFRSAFIADSFISSFNIAIPTSQSLSTQTQDFEPTPLFYQLNLGAQLESRRLISRFRFGYFRFENLPQSVATYSGPLGNTVQNLNDREYQFLNSYAGPFASTSGEYFLNKSHSLIWDAQYLQNLSAEADMGRAWTLESSYKFRWPTRTSVAIFYQHFVIAPDAAVAQYNEDFVGGTNRNGFITGLRISLREKLKLTLSGGLRDAIFESPTIQRENFFKLGLESMNVDI